MTIVRAITALALLAATHPAFAADGLVEIKSPASVQQTTDRLEQLVDARGLTVFARIDHAAGAATIGQTLRPTELLVFGNPRGGTPFIQCAQSIGIDLPLKMLVWEDDDGQVWLGYSDPAFIARRHGVPDCPAVDKLTGALHGLATETVAPQGIQ
jgi:uncharacterized protein (DUF302 family)